MAYISPVKHLRSDRPDLLFLPFPESDISLLHHMFPNLYEASFQNLESLQVHAIHCHRIPSVHPPSAVLLYFLLLLLLLDNSLQKMVFLPDSVSMKQPMLSAVLWQ